MKSEKSPITEAKAFTLRPYWEAEDGSSATSKEWRRFRLSDQVLRSSPIFLTKPCPASPRFSANTPASLIMPVQRRPSIYACASGFWKAHPDRVFPGS